MSERFVHAARTREDIAEVATLAREIWNDHFPPIIGQAQVDYMLDKFQSRDAVNQQIRNEGYEYYLVGDPADRDGYFAIVQDPTESALQLSKLYLRRTVRGRGLGKRVVRWLESECRTRGFERLWLTVNKNNAGSIAFYRRVGFEVESAMVTDIGSGFVMDDYRMVATLQREQASTPILD